MNKQEVFDKVAKHLLTQNKKALDNIEEGVRCVCKYRNDAGLKCAIGCLIPDDKYTGFLEGTSVKHAPDISPLAKILMEIGAWEHRYLLQQLQALHDYFDVEHWPLLLKFTAKANDLLYKDWHYCN